MQIRQNTISVRASTLRSYVESAISWMGSIYKDPESFLLLIDCPGLRAWWQENQTRYNTPFRAFVDAELRQRVRRLSGLYEEPESP